jgi:hypothetical protein
VAWEFFLQLRGLVMRAHLRGIGLVAVVVTAMAGVREGERFSLEAEVAFDAKQAVVLAELEGLGGHPWAGEYYGGDGLGVNRSLTLAPEAGFTFTWEGCLGLYDRNFGAITARGQELQLSFVFENDQEGFRGLAPDLTLVPWGERRYLVPSDEIAAFCSAVNGSTEPRRSLRGNHLLRLGDEQLEVVGTPELPDGYCDLLLPTPILATIQSVGATRSWLGKADIEFHEIPITLDQGHRHGLRVGMILWVIEPDFTSGRCEVIAVEPDRAELLVTQFGDHDPAPHAGWILATTPRYRWRAPR